MVDLAVIIGVVGLVFVGMETYIKRGLQGKVRDWTDYIVSNQQSAAKGAVASTSTLTADSTMNSEEFAGGGRKFSTPKNHPDISTFDYSQ